MTKHTAPEEDLVRRAKAGDRQAFAEIYERHHGAVYRYILYRVGDVTAAEDLAADVFVRVVERIEGFRYRGRPILAWLYTIARNQVIDHVRRAGRRPTLPLEERDAQQVRGARRDQSGALTRQLLATCLRDLTEAQRRVILLKFVEGYSNAEVASIMGKPVGAIKSLQHRALAALRRCIER
jgi:RNA polymerase sigma-70 factor (ECF subfamily)